MLRFLITRYEKGADIPLARAKSRSCGEVATQAKILYASAISRIRSNVMPKADGIPRLQSWEDVKMYTYDDIWDDESTKKTKFYHETLELYEEKEQRGESS